MQTITEYMDWADTLPNVFEVVIEGWGGYTFPKGRMWDVTIERNHDEDWQYNVKMTARADSLILAFEDVYKQYVQLAEEYKTDYR